MLFVCLLMNFVLYGFGVVGLFCFCFGNLCFGVFGFGDLFCFWLVFAVLFEFLDLVMCFGVLVLCLWYMLA